MRDKYWPDESFVTLGPLRYLRRKHGLTSVFILNDHDINMQGKSAAQVKIQTLRDILQAPIKLRLDTIREPTTFDPERIGHVIKLIVGLIQEYGALTRQESADLLRLLGISKSLVEIGAYLLCAEAVGWVVKRTKGYDDFYIARNIKDAATISAGENAKEKNKTRRRLLIRKYWKEKDPFRLEEIRREYGGFKS